MRDVYSLITFVGSTFIVATFTYLVSRHKKEAFRSWSFNFAVSLVSKRATLSDSLPTRDLGLEDTYLEQPNKHRLYLKGGKERGQGVE